MQPAERASSPPTAPLAAPRPAPGAALELLVHGVGGATATGMLDDPHTVRVTGDGIAAVHRRFVDLDAERRSCAPDGRPVPEAYVWSNLTSGSGSRALWLLLLPFMVVNLAHWMRPPSHGRDRTASGYGLLVRLVALSLTVLLVAAVCQVALDLVAWQCAGTRACATRYSWLRFLSPDLDPGGWWSGPGRRLALAALVPAAVTGLLWYLSHRTWSVYESAEPPPPGPPLTDPPDDGTSPPDGTRPHDGTPHATASADGPASAPRAASAARVPGPAHGANRSTDRRPDHGTDPTDHPTERTDRADRSDPTGHPTARAEHHPDHPTDHAHPAPGAPDAGTTPLARPGFWYGRRLVARLRAAHTAAAFLTVAAAVATPVGRFDLRSGGPPWLGAAGLLLLVVIVAGAAVAVAVICRRGRSERHLDRHPDGPLVRFLPSAALAVLVLAAGYALWPRPGWRSGGRLPGDTAFGALMLLQGVLVLALAVTARLLYRAGPAPRTALRGFGGPAVAVLACALGGVMTGGVAQRVADWLDGSGTPGGAGPLPGPPVLLTWQASVIPPLLLVIALVLVRLSVATLRRARAEAPRVPADYPDEHPADPGDPYAPPAGDTARARRIALTRAGAALTDRAPVAVGALAVTTLLFGAFALAGAWGTGEVPGDAAQGTPDLVAGAADTAQAAGSWLIGAGFLLLVAWGRRAYRDPRARRTIGILWDVGTFWPRAAHPFAPPCYAERAVPDLTWRVDTWTRSTRGRLVISGHSQGSVLAAAAAWQLAPDVRARVALLTYGSPLERLYGRWFPSCFGPAALDALHREVDCWRNLYRDTDPIGGPVRLTGSCGPAVDRPALRDPLAFGRTPEHPLPAPVLGHSDYQADPAFEEERARLLRRLRPGALPLPRPAERPYEPREAPEPPAGAG
ncbi:hypothetical protein ACIBCB_23845 [Streptomyces uncialis]|uniref:hypothetical protein n=1 Tax=Streptomyces uncialis TaxID=1048205 RepID=UPI00379F7177